MNDRGLNLELEDCVQLYEDYPKYKQIFDLLFEYTHYYTKREIIHDIYENIMNWKEIRRKIPLFVIIDNNKIGSDHYYYYHFKDILPKHKIILSSNEISDDNDVELLYIDDWSLTGLNMIKLFEPLINRKHRTSEILLTCIISISTIACNTAIMEFKDNYNVSCNIYTSHIIKSFKSILNKMNIPHELIYEFFEDFLTDSNIDIYPVQLEYKSITSDYSDQSIYSKCSIEKKELCEPINSLMSYPTSILQVKQKPTNSTNTNTSSDIHSSTNNISTNSNSTNIHSSSNNINFWYRNLSLKSAKIVPK